MYWYITSLVQCILDTFFNIFHLCTDQNKHLTPCISIRDCSVKVVVTNPNVIQIKLGAQIFVNVINTKRN
jgi:hypothetical protein